MIERNENSMKTQITWLDKNVIFSKKISIAFFIVIFFVFAN